MRYLQHICHTQEFISTLSLSLSLSLSKLLVHTSSSKMPPFKKRPQFLCSDESMKVSQFGNPDDDNQKTCSTSNLKDTEEENKTDTCLTSCTTHEKDSLAASVRQIGDDETKEHEDGCGDSAVGDGKHEDRTKEVVEKECGGLLEQEKMVEIEEDIGDNCLNNNALDIVGDEKEEETREVIHHDGCGDSALGDEKQDGTKEVVEKECGGVLEQEKMAETEDVGHACSNNALDIVDDEKQGQSVDHVRIVEGSSSHGPFDTTAELIKGGKGEGEDHTQVAEMVEAGDDENIRKREPEEETNEANNLLDDVVSLIVHDGGSGGEQVHEAEENELPVIHQPVRRLRLFGVDIDVPQEEVQPTKETGNGTSRSNQESKGHGLSLQKPKIGLRLMGFDL
ncbi:hypothetical protein Hanom_Chr17g01530691 [Helianthus anomalus]